MLTVDMRFELGNIRRPSTETVRETVHGRSGERSANGLHDGRAAVHASDMPNGHRLRASDFDAVRLTGRIHLANGTPRVSRQRPHSPRGGGELPVDNVTLLLNLMTALVKLVTAVAAAISEARGHDAREKKKGRKRKR